MFNKKLVDGLSNLSAAVQKSFGKKKSIESMDALTNLFSKSCDDIIIKTLKDDPSLTYISGYFKVKIDAEKKQVLIEADLYFQNEAGEWIKKENRRDLSVKEMAGPLLQELLETGEVIFEINYPE